MFFQCKTEYEELCEALLAAGLTDDGADPASVALGVLSELVSTLFKSKIEGRSDVLSAVASLEAQLGAQASAKGKEGWFNMAKLGMMKGATVEQFAQSLVMAPRKLQIDLCVFAHRSL